MKLTLNKDGVTYIFEGETAEVTQAVWQMFPSLMMPAYTYTIPAIDLNGYNRPPYVGDAWNQANKTGTFYKVYGD